MRLRPRPSPSAALLIAGLLLAACEPSAAPAAPTPADQSAPMVESGSAFRADATEKAGDPDPGSTRRPSTTALPLEPGVYVAAGEDCAAPANAGFRVYDGRGISGSATRDCRAMVRSGEGDVYRIEQSCVDTYSGDRSTTALTLRLAEDDGFTLTEEGEAQATTFRRCPAGSAPAWLEAAARPGAR